MKQGNLIKNSWFEDSNGNGVFIGGSSVGTTIKDTYFETCGDVNNSDIRILQSIGSTISDTEIINCNFNTSNSDQLQRIKNTGNSYFPNQF